VPKGKKLKVLTHRPRYIEPAAIPEFNEGASSAAKTKEIVPSAQRTEQSAIMPKVPSVETTVADKTEEPKIEEIPKMPEVLSPSTEATVPKMQKSSAATPKRRRMANVLDVVLETARNLESCSYKKNYRSFQGATRS
jgi:hypothetical protein